MVDTEKMDNGSSLTVENNANVTLMKNCTLCGSSAPAVRCDKCGSQTFCLSCDDMYHRHPKRKFHLRKAVDSIWNTYKSPRLRRRTDLPGDPSKIPVAPPRSKKRHSSLELPIGYKEFLQQKKLIEQKLVAGTQNTLSGLPEPNGDDSNIIHDVNMEEDINETAVATVEPLQRRSSIENANTVPDQTSPIHVFVPGIGSVPSDMQSRNTLGYSQTLQGQGIHHSTSATDISAVTSAQPMPPMYHFPPHMHAYMHPQLNPYTPPLAHFNCPQCVSASWSNLMSPNMAAYHQLHMQQQPPWAPPQSPASGSRNSPALDSVSRADHSPLSYHGSLFSSPVFPYPSDGTFTPTMLTKTETTAPGGSDKLSAKSATSPISQSVSPPVSVSGMTSGQKVQLQQILASDEEMEEGEDEEEEEGGNAADEANEEFVIPEKPTTEWECAHCTYVNPPGSHVCDVCCKTSYKIESEPKATEKKKKVKKQTEKKVAGEGSQKQSYSLCGEQSNKETDSRSFGHPQKVI